MSPARGLLQNSVFALAGDLASKGATALVMVLAARELDVGQFALLAAALAVASVLSALFDMGAQTLLTRDGVNSAHARAALIRSLLISRLPLLAATLVIGAALGLATGQLPVALLTVSLGALGAGQMLLTGALRSAQNLLPEAVLKLANGILTLVACGICAIFAPSAAAFLAGLCAALALVLVPSSKLTGRLLAAGQKLGLRTALRRSLPLGVMALATLAYYRSGTILLKVLSSSSQTALFAAASTVGFALLMAGNAITTGLLPKLAATDVAAHPRIVRRAALCALAILMALGATVALFAHPLLVGLFGARYGAAAPALRILALSTPLIGPTGVLGIALIAQGRLRPIYIQVTASLVVNLLVMMLLARTHGAVGAALATLCCEALAAQIMVYAAVRALPGLLGTDRPAQVSLPRTGATAEALR